MRRKRRLSLLGELVVEVDVMINDFDGTHYIFGANVYFVAALKHGISRILLINEDRDHPFFTQNTAYNFRPYGVFSYVYFFPVWHYVFIWNDCVKIEKNSKVISLPAQVLAYVRPPRCFAQC